MSMSGRVLRTGWFVGALAVGSLGPPAPASGAGTPVPYNELRLASSDAVRAYGNPTSTTGNCTGTAQTFQTTVGLSADGAGNGLLSIGTENLGNQAHSVSEISSSELELDFSGSGTDGSGGTYSATSTFHGYGTAFTGTYTLTLTGTGGSCTVVRPQTLTLQGSGLTLVSSPAPPPPPPPPPAAVASATSVICNYEFQGAVDVCAATVGGGSTTNPTGQARFATRTAGAFVSGSVCTLGPTSHSPTSSCTVRFKPASNDLSVITSMVMDATYGGDSHYLPSSGQSHAAVAVPVSGGLQTSSSLDITSTLASGGINLAFDNPDPGGTVDVTIAESGSLATGGAISVNRSRRLKGKLILARLQRRLRQTGPVTLHVKLTARGRGQLKRLERRHTRRVRIILKITYRRGPT